MVDTGYNFRFYIAVFIVFTLLTTSLGKKVDKKAKDNKKEEKWKKKDIRDYSEADLERLYDQWEVCRCCCSQSLYSTCILCLTYFLFKR